MAETTFQKISRKTGRKQTFCKCTACKRQCQTPCMGTPQDIEAIIDAGHGDKIFPTVWGAGVMMGVSGPVLVYAADRISTGCIFFKDGLCTLHDAGLKPTEGKLSHHSVRLDNFDPKKSVSWAVVKEWLNPDNAEVVKRIEQKCPNK